MAQNVIINGVTYQNCPEVDIPKSGGGTAKFVDTDDANATANDILSGKSAYVNGLKVNGNVSGKAAQTYTRCAESMRQQRLSEGCYRIHAG